MAVVWRSSYQLYSHWQSKRTCFFILLFEYKVPAPSSPGSGIFVLKLGAIIVLTLQGLLTDAYLHASLGRGAPASKEDSSSETLLTPTHRCTPRLRGLGRHGPGWLHPLLELGYNKCKPSTASLDETANRTAVPLASTPLPSSCDLRHWSLVERAVCRLGSPGSSSRPAAKL